MELVHLGFRVALAEEHEIDLFRGVAILEHRPHTALSGPRGRIHEAGVRVERNGPQLAKGALGVPLLEDQLDRTQGPGESERLVESSVCPPSLTRRLPFAIDGSESARVDDPVAPRVDNLEQVLAQVRVVHQLRKASRPGAVRHHPVQREDLLAHTTGVEVV